MSKQVNLCLIKHVSGYPCPSCGTTRSIIDIVQGKFEEAIAFHNPLGYLAVFLMLVLPIWLFIDFVSRKDGLYACYLKIEKFIHRPPIALLGIVLILANWIWNISKNL